MRAGRSPLSHSSRIRHIGLSVGGHTLCPPLSDNHAATEFVAARWAQQTVAASGANVAGVTTQWRGWVGGPPSRLASSPEWSRFVGLLTGPSRLASSPD
ncbi:hypothetical protein MB901379_04904 [Mycobacterium basiliense]|uniref:Uncharacterized protein n=1 Tax=Mycobacterium basiliense TaxID=2094119 RepID=A0A447GLK3_9MYCO|nr:hypothetical protein MB901379_04904 [Mycobacterium basiliense]